MKLPDYAFTPRRIEVRPGIIVSTWTSKRRAGFNPPSADGAEAELRVDPSPPAEKKQQAGGLKPALRCSQLNQQARESFLDRLTDVIAATEVTVIAIVIDKIKHKARYNQPYHPYHLAMEFGLERVHNFLRIKNQTDHETFIIFEARGPKEDQALELEFRRVCDGGNRDRASLPLRFMVADKKTNSEGLQLADLTARPIGLSVLRPEQANRAWNVLQSKLFAGRHNSVTGNGLKVFP